MLVPNINMHLVPLTLPNPQNNSLLGVMWCTTLVQTALGRSPTANSSSLFPHELKLVNVSIRHFSGDLRSRAWCAIQSPWAHQPRQCMLHAAERTACGGRGAWDSRPRSCTRQSHKGCSETGWLQEDMDTCTSTDGKGKLPLPKL